MMRCWAPSASGLAGFAIGTLVAIPLLRAVTGGGVVLYLIPLGGLLTASLLRGVGADRIALPRTGVLYLGLLALFVVWMGMSSLWTIPTVNVSEDLVLLAGLFAITAASFLGLREGAVEPALRWMVVAALAVAGYVFRIYIKAGALGGYGMLSEMYLVVAQAIGVGTVLALVMALTRSGRDRGLAALAATVLVPALALSLARGALLFVVLVTILAAGFWNWRRIEAYNSFRRWLRGQFARLALLSAAFGVAGIAMGGAFQVDRTRSRLERLFSGREFTDSTRPRMWREALESINEAPLFGHGLGSSGLMSGTAEQFYPHNWVLQVWVEGGLVGLVLCIATIAAPLFYAWKQADKWGEPSLRRSLPVAAAYLFLLLEYSKSYDFYSARLLFVIGGMLIYVARITDMRFGVEHSS